jgi:hypothetical protein
MQILLQLRIMSVTSNNPFDRQAENLSIDLSNEIVARRSAWIQKEKIQTKNENLEYMASPNFFTSISLAIEYFILSKNGLLKIQKENSTIELGQVQRNQISDLYFLSRNIIWWDSLLYYIWNHNKIDLEKCSHFITQTSKMIVTPQQLSTSLIFTIKELGSQNIIEIIKTTNIKKITLEEITRCHDCCHLNHSDCGINYHKNPGECFIICLEK